MATDTKVKRWRFGRLQLGFNRHIHTYAPGDKRYVLQPVIIWDYCRRKDLEKIR